MLARRRRVRVKISAASRRKSNIRNGGFFIDFFSVQRRLQVKRREYGIRALPVLADSHNLATDRLGLFMRPWTDFLVGRKPLSRLSQMRGQHLRSPARLAQSRRRLRATRNVHLVNG